MASSLATLLDRVLKSPSTPAGLEALVQAWRAAPAPALLELVHRFEQAHPPPPFEGSSEEFAVRAKLAGCAERGTLARALRGPRSADTVTRLKAVARWEPDPRVSRAVEQLLREVPYTSDSARPVWTAAFALVAKLGDPRFTALAAQLPKEWKFRQNQVEWMTSGLARATSALPKEPPALSAAEVKTVEAIAAKLQPTAAPAERQAEASLLAAVYEDPRSDGPRLVYSDWLQEAGDPRGEFIALQFNPRKTSAELKREAALLKAHGAKWLGPLAPAVLKGVEFRRGFPAVVTARFKHEKDALGHGGSEAWATVEEIAWSAGTGLDDRWSCFLPPALRPLAVIARGPAVAQLLDAQRPWEIERLDVQIYDLDLHRRFARSSLFPKVAQLKLTTYGRPELFRDSWMARVPEIILAQLDQGSLAPWLGALSSTAVKRLTVEPSSGGRLIFDRGPDGALSAAVLEVAGRMNEQAARGQLERIPAGWLSALTISGLASEELEELRRSRVRVAGAAAPQLPPLGAIAPCKRVTALHWAGGALRAVADDRLVQHSADRLEPTEDFPLNPLADAAFSPDGRAVAAGRWRNVEYRDAATGEVVTRLKLASNLKQLQFDATGASLLCLGEGTMSVHVVPSGAERRALSFGSHPLRPVCAAISPDGQSLAVALYNDQVVVYPAGATRAGRKYPHPSYVNQVLFAGQALVTSCRDGKLRRFDPRDESSEPQAEQLLGEAAVLTLSPDARLLAASTADGTAFLDASTLAVKERTKIRLGSPVFSADGKRVLGHTAQGFAVIDAPG